MSWTSVLITVSVTLRRGFLRTDLGCHRFRLSFPHFPQIGPVGHISTVRLLKLANRSHTQCPSRRQQPRRCGQTCAATAISAADQALVSASTAFWQDPGRAMQIGMCWPGGGHLRLAMFQLLSAAPAEPSRQQPKKITCTRQQKSCFLRVVLDRWICSFRSRQGGSGAGSKSRQPLTVHGAARPIRNRHSGLDNGGVSAVSARGSGRGRQSVTHRPPPD
ncbi:hypothetical protein B0T16DRAFT_137668 [Cercophora newfieldiana]|uniref:Uncharacterized protein n=1 Tax=Cercophora newfieldiana TaxID=92897 RepID=A0AA39YC21_9PEZI|nr:hypothetical protein B0T16DRAFT_137668 [Cercophora newfieldiana]